METSAVNLLWKVIQEHLKNPFDKDEWIIAIEFAQQIEQERIKKAYIEGAISIHNNMKLETDSFLDENNLTENLKKFINEKSNLN